MSESSTWHTIILPKKRREEKTELNNWKTVLNTIEVNTVMESMGYCYVLIQFVVVEMFFSAKFICLFQVDMKESDFVICISELGQRQIEAT